MARFGSSGIRGPYPTVVHEDLARRLGAAVGAESGSVVVGRDARVSSPALAAAVAEGVLAAGGRVLDAGLVPTPTLAFAARRAGAGLMVTASHNPPQDNGFKPWNPDGSAFDAAQRARVEAALDGPPRRGASAGAYEPDPEALQRHAAALLAAVPPPGRRLKVVLDGGNGPGALLTPALLRAAGHDVVTLHADPDGLFRGRPSEPTPATLSDLAAVVPAVRADLGLAHDGDADRVAACDARGRVLDGDQTLALLARAADAKDLVVSVDTSRIVERALPGARVRLAKVGDAYVSERLKAEGGDLGGEPSGAYILPRVSYCPDGPHAALLLAALVAREGPLAALVDGLPRLPRAREAVAVPRERMAGVVADAAERLRALGDVSTLDGVRVDAPDGWILVRASGTEPKVRIAVEADTEDALKRLLALARDAVRAG